MFSITKLVLPCIYYCKCYECRKYINAEKVFHFVMFEASVCISQNWINHDLQTACVPHEVATFPHILPNKSAISWVGRDKKNKIYGEMPLLLLIICRRVTSINLMDNQIRIRKRLT